MKTTDIWYSGVVLGFVETETYILGKGFQHMYLGGI